MVTHASVTVLGLPQEFKDSSIPLKIAGGLWAY
jgi:hypothetical protein